MALFRWCVASALSEGLRQPNEIHASQNTRREISSGNFSQSPPKQSGERIAPKSNLFQKMTSNQSELTLKIRRFTSAENAHARFNETLYSPFLPYQVLPGDFKVLILNHREMSNRTICDKAGMKFFRLNMRTLPNKSTVLLSTIIIIKIAKIPKYNLNKLHCLPFIASNISEFQ